MKDKISVIVPVYNAERFLEKCVCSILNQTYSNIELILVNDGSNDNSLELCNKIAEADSRVVVVDKPNGGAASARNVGLDHATGKYIGFCDSDDFLNLDMYETLIKVLDENNLDMIACLSNAVDLQGNVLDKQDASRKLVITNSCEYIKSIYLWIGDVSLCSRVFRRELIEDLRIPEGRRVEDFYFIISCLTKTDKNATYLYPFYNYRNNPDSVTQSGGGSIYLDSLYFYDLALELLKDYPCDMKLEQEHYLLKVYSLMAILSTKDEINKHQLLYNKCQKDIRAHFGAIGKNPYLNKKEKIVLYLSCISMRLARATFYTKELIASLLHR